MPKATMNLLVVEDEAALRTSLFSFLLRPLAMVFAVRQMVFRRYPNFGWKYPT